MELKNKELNYKLLCRVMENFTIKQISEMLSVNINTVKRWVDLKNLPWQYVIDLKKINGEEVQYEELTFIEKDQFFTNKKTVDHCLKLVETKLDSFGLCIDDFTLIEPSAGDGAFFDEFPHDDKIGMDIEPKKGSIIRQDFLSWFPPINTKPFMVIGNPPFGLRGNLALRFINHASKFCDFVCFVLPPLFDSDGKGSCMGRVKNMNLVLSEKIDNNFVYPNGEEINVNVIFQIWSKNHKNDKKNEKTCDSFIKVYSLTDGGTPSTTRNKKMQDKCDFYIASSSYEKDKMTLYPSFDDLPNRRGYGIKILKNKSDIQEVIKNIDWPSKSFLATNSSYNLRTSIIKNSIIEMGFYDK